MATLKTKITNIKPLLMSAFIIVVTFSTYFSMYAFRKAFSVAEFEGLYFGGIEFKVFLVVTQILGYTISKFIGIKVVSELDNKKRELFLAALIFVAEGALLLFWLVPYPYNFPFLFINGLPLGMIWGVLFSYLEGRFNTEVLAIGLCTSFISASGVVKSVGRYLILTFGITEFQMPFFTGLIFLPLFLLLLVLLTKIPKPTKEEEKAKTKRVPMTSSDRKALFTKYAFGIVVLTLSYMLLSAYRDLRDNFAIEIWTAVGYSKKPAIFSVTEVPLAVVVPVLLSFIFLVKDNVKAFKINLYAIFLGFMIVGLSTFMYTRELINPVAWMIATGFGLYLSYVPFNSILFDRMVALYKKAANTSFLINIADSWGYLASVGVVLFKNFGQANMSWYNFFLNSGYWISIGGMLLIAGVIVYFNKKTKKM